ncbi:sugar O-acetyltransferase [Shimwellia pseudoproteus]|uniref:sugar O-acetyltransferase n=1 Tax=Shimwellia pseudoproteus TaxID=570012 RepID=UPI0018EDC20A|nr:sugar O-acetyltransferase [Shimwellia pseudoproteus]MBJ3816398.1 sugar O-acetyltransferase [Shimwellia pseudoproteus]
MNPITAVPDGELYDANNDPRILTLRTRAKSLCFDYNAIRPGEDHARLAILQQLLGTCGKGIIIEPPFWCDYGSLIHVGDNVYANHNLVILDGAPVTIGNHVFIAPNVGIHTAGHPLDAARRNQGLEFAKGVTIGNNVWIGASAVLLPGVTIGDNSMIAAGSVVNRDIPPGVVAAGNPCRVLRPIIAADAQRTRF